MFPKSSEKDNKMCHHSVVLKMICTADQKKRWNLSSIVEKKEKDVTIFL
jgi:hypothetical protein